MYAPPRTAPSLDPRRPFSRADARAAGLTPEMLLARRFKKLFWDSYVLRDVKTTPLLRAQAVLNLVPEGSHISHQTAAELWGATVPDDGNTHVRPRPRRDGTFAKASRPTTGTARLRRRFARGCPSRHPKTDVSRPCGRRKAQLVDLVVAADGMIKAGHTTQERLIEAAAEWHGRGCRCTDAPGSQPGREWTPPPRRSFGCSSCSPGCPSRESTSFSGPGTAAGHGATTWRTSTSG